jgi:hypothetical protein
MICLSFAGSIRRAFHRRRGQRRALAQRVLEVDRNAVLLEQIGERLVRQFLNSPHPVARELLQLVERIVIEGDQFAHDWPTSCVATIKRENRKTFRNHRNSQPLDHKGRSHDDQNFRDGLGFCNRSSRCPGRRVRSEQRRRKRRRGREWSIGRHGQCRGIA